MLTCNLLIRKIRKKLKNKEIVKTQTKQNSLITLTHRKLHFWHK